MLLKGTSRSSFLLHQIFQTQQSTTIGDLKLNENHRRLQLGLPQSNTSASNSLRDSRQFPPPLSLHVIPKLITGNTALAKNHNTLEMHASPYVTEHGYAEFTGRDLMFISLRVRHIFGIKLLVD